MYLSDSMESKCLKIKEMSKADWYEHCEGELSTGLYNNKTRQNDADIMVTINENGSLNIFLVA